MSNYGVVSKYTYHPETGKIIKIIVDDLSTSFNYDKKGKMIHAENSHGDEVDLVYDAKSNIQHMVAINKKVKSHDKVALKYNAKDQPVEINIIGTGKVAIVYEDNGEISNISSNEGPEVALKVTAVFQNLMSIIKGSGTIF